MDIKMVSSNAVYSLGLALVLVGAVLLCTLASSLLPAYNYSRHVDRVRCTVSSSQFVGNVCCEASVRDMDDCTKGFKYPCLKVNVTIDDDDDAENVLLYDEFHSAYYGGRIDDCSYFHCETGSYKDHLKKAKEFKKEYDEGDELNCYYHKSRKHVALSKIVERSAVTHALVWSLLLLIGGLVTCVVMLIIDWRNKKNERHYGNMKETAKTNDVSSDHDDDSDIETIHVDGEKKKTETNSNGIVSSPSKNKLVNNSTPVKKA